MKSLLPLLAVFLLSVQIASAQETPEPTDWTTEQRCITAPSQPPEGWTYDGVIFTFIPGDGIHARRADMDTPYYVAFDSDSEFGVAGRFSPNGRWFAVPEGRATLLSTLPDYYFDVSEISVYSTDPAHEVYRIPITLRHRGGSARSSIPPILWLDNQRFVSQGVPERYAVDEKRLINPFEEIIEPYEFPIADAYYVSISPDGSRFVYTTSTPGSRANYRLMTPEGEDVSNSLNLQDVYYAPMLREEQWTSDSSRFAAIMQGGHDLHIYDRDGNGVDEIESDVRIANFSYAQDGRELAYGVTNGLHSEQFQDGWRGVWNSGKLYIANFETRTITDTCIETQYSMAFSPDGDRLAFGLYDAGYTYILDLEAWQAYRIDLAAADVVGWYPLDE